MMRLIDSELFKLRTTRTFLGICLGVALIVGLLSGLISLLDSFDGTGSPGQDMASIGTLAQPFALVIGVLGTSTEFRHKTITPTLLAVPDRVRLLAAKLVAHLAAGFVFGGVMVLLAAGLSSAILSSRGIDTGLSSTELGNLAIGGAVGAALYAGIGVGLGALVPNQVGATIAALAWVFFLEQLIASLSGVTEITTYGLSGLASALSTADMGLDSDDLLDPLPAGLVLLGYALAFCAAGAAMLRRRDIEG
jgi:hypothetical protein